MGAGNVKLVYARWASLPDGPFRVLAYMALVSLDDDNPPRFWGGREALALATGRIVADRLTTDPAEIAARRAAFKAVGRMLAALKDAGAITLEAAAHTNRNAVYRLDLGLTGARSVGTSRPESPPLDGYQSTESTPLTGDHSARAGSGTRPPEGPSGPRLVGVEDPDYWAEWSPVSGTEDPGRWGPKEYKDQGTTQGNDEAADLRTAVTVARAYEAVDTPKISPPQPRTGHPFRRGDRAAQTIAEASARRAAARAAHHAAGVAE